MKYTISVLLLATLVGCHRTMPEEVTKALDAAGKNKGELQKVIDHYKYKLNKEKLLAAYFLIGNMPGKEGIYYPENAFYFDLIKKTDSLQKSTCSDYTDTYIQEYLTEDDRENSVHLQKAEDIKVITADLLIENIDLAFKVWKEKPWAKHVTFDEFCEWILPYRAANEPLQRWRPYILRQLEHLEDSLQDPSDPKEICMMINRVIARDFVLSLELDAIPKLGGIDSWDHKAGICEHRFLITMLACRSMGVPIRKDFTFKFAVWPNDHGWTVLLDSDGTIKPFDGGNTSAKLFDPPNCPTWPGGIALVTTVFRNSFAVNKEHLNFSNNGQIPKKLVAPCIEEVSHEYDSSNRGDLQVEITRKRKSEYAVLYSFDEGLSLIAVAYSTIQEGKALFKNIQYGGIYLVGHLVNSKMLPDNDPFFWEKGNKQVYLTPITEQRVTCTLHRKFPPQAPVFDFGKNAVGSVIQGSHSPDFKNATTLYTITHTNNFDPFEEIINSPAAFRYYRYLSADTGFIRLADIILYKSDKWEHNSRITGKVYGHISEQEDCNEGIFEHAFDGNIRTNFNAPAGSWVALDAGKPVTVKSFRLIIRNHLNYVEPGDTYELFYFDKKWNSLGIKKAASYSVSYNNIPKNAVLLLKNHTRGKQERIFLIEENKQSWR